MSKEKGATGPLFFGKVVKRKQGFGESGPERGPGRPPRLDPVRAPPDQPACSGEMEISTRRFWARPASVALEAMGRLMP